MTANTAMSSVPIAVTLELFGTARIKAGARAVVLYMDPAATVADLARELSRECPGFLGSILSEDGAIVDGYALNKNGLYFLPAEPETLLQLAEGDTLLLLSNQAGG